MPQFHSICDNRTARTELIEELKMLNPLAGGRARPTGGGARPTDGITTRVRGEVPFKTSFTH